MRAREQLLEKRCALYEAALQDLSEGQAVEPLEVLGRALRRFPITDNDLGSMEMIRNLYSRLQESKHRARQYQHKCNQLEDTQTVLREDLEEVRHLLDLQEQQFYDTKRERDAAKSSLARVEAQASYDETLSFAVWSQHPEQTKLLKRLLLNLRMLLAGEDLRDPAWLKSSMRSLRQVWGENEEFLRQFATP